MGGLERSACVDPAMVPPQPLAVEQVRAGELHAHACAAERVDRLAVEALGGIALAQQRAAARQATINPDEVWTSAYGAVELIEAAARTGATETAATHLERLTIATQASATPYALGLAARCRALLGEGEAAERLYREAIDALGATRVRVDLARAHLLYGEWLRRAHRRLEAREQLRTAQDLFTDMGLEAFAARAGNELRATGETASRRRPEPGAGLTAQEDRIAQLARDGLTNAEIGARLFISSRTVEYHLHKVFTKLGVRSRGELEGARLNT